MLLLVVYCHWSLCYFSSASLLLSLSNQHLACLPHQKTFSLITCFQNVCLNCVLMFPLTLPLQKRWRRIAAETWVKSTIWIQNMLILRLWKTLLLLLIWLIISWVTTYCMYTEIKQKSNAEKVIKFRKKETNYLNLQVRLRKNKQVPFIKTI